MARRLRVQFEASKIAAKKGQTFTFGIAQDAFVRPGGRQHLQKALPFGISRYVGEVRSGKQKGELVGKIVRVKV